jgi:hypothetical protein
VLGIAAGVPLRLSISRAGFSLHVCVFGCCPACRNYRRGRYLKLKACDLFPLLYSSCQRLSEC